MSTYPVVSTLATIYCTDENLAIRATGDFPVLCPDWQVLAQGTDGVFGAGDRWTLGSATVDFAAQGVGTQHVIRLTKPTSTFRGSGQLLAVGTVNVDGSVTLRRLGEAAGVGQPPGIVGGLTGVEFAIATLDPQIEEECYNINRRFNIDPSSANRSPSDLTDLRDLRSACVLGVLKARYAIEARTKTGDYALKLAEIAEELSEVYGRLSIRWATAAAGSESTNWFSMRVNR